MTTLLAGLVLFLGAHSVRIFADGWRSAQIAFHAPVPARGRRSTRSFPSPASR
jgi:uncharacterized membrane protein